MATTSLWHIKGQLCDLIDYVENPDKTNLNNGLKDFINVFSYDTNPIKTNNRHFVTTINCKKEIALEQMILTKKQFNKEDNKGNSGVPLTTNPPFGYTREWESDEPAAEVVRKIFSLCIKGYGPTQIAKQLSAAEIMTPCEYWISIGRNCGKPPTKQFNWCGDTVASILSKQE